MPTRRAFVQQLALLAAAVLAPACAGTRPPNPPRVSPPPPEPLALPPLPELLTSASLDWLILARPKEFTRYPELDQGIRRLVPDARRAVFEHAFGIRIDAIEHLVVGSYPGSTIFLVDHVPDPLLAERLYRERLMTDVTRSVRRHDLVITRGKNALGEKRCVAAMGKETVAIESGSWLHTRVAALYAEGKLHRAPRALELTEVRALLDHVGDAPLLGIAPGPFEGEWEQALHGLLGVCTAAIAAVRPVGGGTLDAKFALAGDWGQQPSEALERLDKGWNDLSRSSFGKLTGLNAPIAPPRTATGPGLIELSVTLNGAQLADGLYTAVSAEARDIMRL